MEIVGVLNKNNFSDVCVCVEERMGRKYMRTASTYNPLPDIFSKEKKDIVST